MKIQNPTPSILRSIVSLFGLSAALVIATGMQADILANYTFDAASPASTDADANSVASNFLVGAGFVGKGSFSAATETAFVNASNTLASESAAVDGDNYFSFTVTAGEGFELNLSSLTFDTIFNGTDPIAAVTSNFVVRSSADNFTANLGSFAEAYQTGSSFSARSIDLSGSDFQSIAGAMAFRFYIYDDSGALNRVSRLDNVVLNGTAVSIIPEPSTTVLLAGLVMLATVGASRRRHSPIAR